jgi:SAM-dependent methyltransferase
MIPSARCTVCGDEGVEVWWSDGDRKLFYCRACDTRFLHPRPEAEALSQVYSESYFRDHYVAHADIRLAYFRDRIQDLERRTPHRRVIDVGCGPGYFLQAATEAGWDAAGIDISPVAVGYARAAGLSAVVAELSVYTPPLQPDVVTMWDVVAHLRDPRSIVIAAASMLLPGGLLVMKFPYRHRSLYRIVRLFSRGLPAAGLLALTSQPHHFTPSSAAYLLEIAGCRVLATEVVPEIELPIQASDSMRLRVAKLVTSAVAKTGMYRSIVVYGERLSTPLER